MYLHLTIRPIELRDANQFIDEVHRHHYPVQGHRFSISVVDDNGVLHGVATIGRAVARLSGLPLEVLEVTRLATDGTPNACSMLYAAAARIGKELGYVKIQTYILQEEPGTSLKASGWIDEGLKGGGQWKHTDGRMRRQDQPNEQKRRFYKPLNPSGLLPKKPIVEFDLSELDLSDVHSESKTLD